ncbi:putative receptor-like protein kinase [Forsythia ovata]|uniref:Receptor-like protein kinase n=1 Tax=Forsythia ovata TaxID=205694 RepID=A0ABD1R6R2_9LAMI
MDSTTPRPKTIPIEYNPLPSVEEMFNSMHVVVVSIIPHAKSYNCVLIKKKTVLWDSDLCMIRYSNEYIFGTLETSPRIYWWNMNNVTNQEKFNKDLRALLDCLRGHAAYGFPKKFAAANGTGPDILTIYGLVQCTLDLTSEDCRGCLIQVANVIPNCCNGKQGFAIFTPNCILQYEIYPFYTYTPQLAPPPATTPVPVPVLVPTPLISTPPGEEILYRFYFI